MKTLEERISQLELQYITLYNRMYAIGMRRDRIANGDKSAQRCIAKARRLINGYDKLSKDIGSLRKAQTTRGQGRLQPVYLNAKQLVKFRSWLANDFRKSSVTTKWS